MQNFALDPLKEISDTSDDITIAVFRQAFLVSEITVSYSSGGFAHYGDFVLRPCFQQRLKSGICSYDYQK